MSYRGGFPLQGQQPGQWSGQPLYGQPAPQGGQYPPHHGAPAQFAPPPVQPHPSQPHLAQPQFGQRPFGQPSARPS